MNYLDYLCYAIEILPKNMKSMCFSVISDPRFQIAPGGSSHHHNYEGGLIQHTSEVVKTVIEMSEEENQQMLITAAIFHDRNKIFEYEIKDGKVIKLPYRVLIGHVVGSYVFFLEQAKIHGLEADMIERIGHCLLSHHGRLEWRSPVEPMTKEAHILHSADMLSARPIG